MGIEIDWNLDEKQELFKDNTTGTFFTGKIHTVEETEQFFDKMTNGYLSRMRTVDEIKKLEERARVIEHEKDLLRLRLSNLTEEEIKIREKIFNLKFVTHGWPY